jgi:hypothetical protein
MRVGLSRRMKAKAYESAICSGKSSGSRTLSEAWFGIESCRTSVLSDASEA